MKHNLIYKDDEYEKFWDIEVSGKSFTMSYGNTGVLPIVQIKNFDSEEKCLNMAENLVQWKLQVGYEKRLKTHTNIRCKRCGSKYDTEYEQCLCYCLVRMMPLV